MNQDRERTEEKTGKTHEEQVKEIRKLVADIRYGMLTTVEKDGTLHSRPMATQQIEEDGSLYFFLYNHSPKTDEIQKDHHVNVSFSEPKDNKYVSLSGKGWIVQDKDKMKELWNPLLKTWFPKGLEEPNIALLRVTIDRAEYWNYSSGTILKLVGFAKSIVTGRRAENMGSNEKVSAPLTGEKKDLPLS